MSSSNEFVFETYPKIYGPFKRFTDGKRKNQLDTTRWTNDALTRAIERVELGVRSNWSTRDNLFYSEGLVGTPVGGLLNRDGSRIQVKVKHVDFFKGANDAAG